MDMRSTSERGATCHPAFRNHPHPSYGCGGRVRNVSLAELKRGSRLLSFSPCDPRCDRVEISNKNDVGIPSYTTIIDQKWDRFSKMTAC